MHERVSNLLLRPAQTERDYTTRRDFFVFKSKQNRQWKEILKICTPNSLNCYYISKVWKEWKSINVKRYWKSNIRVAEPNRVLSMWALMRENDICNLKGRYDEKKFVYF